MKISNSTSSYINQTYANANNAANQASKARSKEDVAGAPPQDNINLSGRTRELQQISKAIETDSTDRQKYVAEIKDRVETQQYTVNAEAVAEKIAGNFMDEIV